MVRLYTHALLESGICVWCWEQWDTAYAAQQHKDVSHAY
jgi:hypothetical protein